MILLDQGGFIIFNIKKVLAVILTVVLILPVCGLTVSALEARENEQVITISNLSSSHTGAGAKPSSTKICTSGFPSGKVEIVSEEWSCPHEMVVSGKDIEVRGGKYSYLIFREKMCIISFVPDCGSGI